MLRWMNLLPILILTACAQSPTGRTQLQIVPEQQLDEMGATAYQQMKQSEPVSQDPRVNRYVQCVANAIISASSSNKAWETTVFASDAINAFALPGGKIGVYTGILNVAQGQDQLGAIIGHEVAHVLARHHNARISAEYATQTGLQILSGAAGPERQQLLGLLGVGAQYGILMPYGRGQESEADILGVELMARAGFDPRASVELWRNMDRASGGSPPAFLSTHPANAERIRELQGHMPRALSLYQEAQRSGRRPQCQ